MKPKKVNLKDLLAEIRSLQVELSRISKFMKVSASAQAMQLLDKVAFTPERKRIWIHCDGKRTRAEIEKEANVAHLTASDFLDECVRLGLIEEEKKKGGHPKRIIDYVPRDWEKVTKPTKEEPKVDEIKTTQTPTHSTETPPTG